MQVLYFIPARGGSKGIPDKNLREVGGIPLVARAIQTAAAAARKAGHSNRIVCSTDSERIAAVARQWGAEVPFLRPEELATDTAGTTDTILHALTSLGGDFDAVVLIQPTSPLVQPEDVLGALALHLTSGDPVVSICALEHPIGWALRRDEADRLRPIFPNEQHARRQDCQAAFRQNGAVFVAPPWVLRTAGDFLTANTRGWLMPADRSLDVDCPADLDLAEAELARRPEVSFADAGLPIGGASRCYIIAEAGVNHNGDLAQARRLVEAAAASGADAVKFQTWITEKICQPGARKAAYQVGADDPLQDQFEMLKRLELPYAWHAELKAQAEALGITFLSTPDEIDSARFLLRLGVPFLKIGSAEVTNLPYLADVADLGHPLILSTGMSTLADVARAVATIRSRSSAPFALLHCVSAYPAPDDEMNLSAIRTLNDSFSVPVGLSDHTSGSRAATIGAALGMRILEKHLTLDRHLPGPDQAASIEPDEFKQLVSDVRAAERMLGDGQKRVSPAEADIRQAVQRTLVYACDLPAGHRLAIADLTAVRTGREGIRPTDIGLVLEKVLRDRVRQGVTASPRDVE